MLGVLLNGIVLGVTGAGASTLGIDRIGEWRSLGVGRSRKSERAAEMALWLPAGILLRL
ncbi:MAG: hypothetical protein U0X75_25145 [Acidobacteriota bacterium]